MPLVLTSVPLVPARTFSPAFNLTTCQRKLLKPILTMTRIMELDEPPIVSMGVRYVLIRCSSCGLCLMIECCGCPQKAEARRRWLALLDSTTLALNASKHSPHRFTLRSAQATLDEAVSISTPYTTALASAGSSAQAAEDFASMERLRANLGEVVKVSIVIPVSCRGQC